MKILFGLGNPDKEYLETRHNAGFLFVDEMCKGGDYKSEAKFEAMIFKTEKVWFVKPTTYMNNAGRSLRKIVDFYKLSIEDVVVVHDDLDLKMGEFKIQKGVGPKVHNGLISVDSSLGTSNYWRVRIGVDGRDSRGEMSGADYVLQRMKSSEKEIVMESIRKAISELMIALSL